MFSKNAFFRNEDSESTVEVVDMPTGPIYYRDCEASDSQLTFRKVTVPAITFKHPDGRTFSMPKFVVDLIEGLQQGTLFRKSSIETMLKGKGSRDHGIQSDAHAYCRFTEAFHLGCSTNPGWIFFMVAQEADENGVKGRWFRHPTQDELNAGNIRKSEMLTRRGAAATTPATERMPSDFAIANARKVLERAERAMAATAPATTESAE